MLNSLLEELKIRQERMHRRSKKEFREYLKTKANDSGLDFAIQGSKSGLAKNVVIGDLINAKYVIGAHYDTPPRLPSFMMKSTLLFNILMLSYGLWMIIAAFINTYLFFVSFGVYVFFFLYILGFFSIANKYNYNDNSSGVLTLLYLMNKLKDEKVAYVFFDNEEKGLLGSAQFRKSYGSRLSKKEFIILDCVGKGKHFGLFSYGKSKLSKEIEKLASDIKSDYVFEARKASFIEMSDHFSFSNLEHVGIMCYNKYGKKYRLNNIHSHKDKSIDLNNIHELSEVIIMHIKGKDDMNG